MSEGISRVGDILDIGVDLGVIEKRGSFYNYGDLRLAQGRENAKGFLRDNLELTGEVEARIKELHGLAPSGHLVKGDTDDVVSLDE